MLLRKMIENFDAVKDGSVEGRILNLYSGHETNVASLLYTLGVFEPHAPAYGSAIITELTELRGQYYVNVSILWFLTLHLYILSTP